MSPPQGASQYSCCSNKIKNYFILLSLISSRWLFSLLLLCRCLSLSQEPININTMSLFQSPTRGWPTSASLPLNIRMLFTAGFCLDSIWVWLGFGWVQFGFCLGHFNQYRSPVVCTLYWEVMNRLNRPSEKEKKKERRRRWKTLEQDEMSTHSEKIDEELTSGEEASRVRVWKK